MKSNLLQVASRSKRIVGTNQVQAQYCPRLWHPSFEKKLYVLPRAFFRDRLLRIPVISPFTAVRCVVVVGVVAIVLEFAITYWRVREIAFYCTVTSDSTYMYYTSTIVLLSLSTYTQIRDLHK